MTIAGAIILVFSHLCKQQLIGRQSSCTILNPVPNLQMECSDLANIYAILGRSAWILSCTGYSQTKSIDLLNTYTGNYNFINLLNITQIS